jgi:hypothetical protein
MPWLPDRVRVDELKKYGLVNLVHTRRRGAEPWLPRGFYKFVAPRDQKLYVVEITSNVVRGNKACAWLYRPIIRVKTSMVTTAHPCG